MDGNPVLENQPLEATSMTVETDATPLGGGMLFFQLFVFVPFLGELDAGPKETVGGWGTCLIEDMHQLTIIRLLLSFHKPCYWASELSMSMDKSFRDLHLLHLHENWGCCIMNCDGFPISIQVEYQMNS